MARSRRAGPVAWVVVIAAVAGASASAASAQEPYRTPRAGEGFETDLFGKKVSVPRRDRRSTRALTLGGMYFEPPVDGSSGTPLFNLYWRRYWDERRVFGLFSGFFDFVEFAEHIYTSEGRPRALLEAVTLFENYTIPTPLTEINAKGRKAEGSEVWWGRISTDLGLGGRRGITPFEVDNSVRLQLFAHIQWDYFDDAKQTPDDAIVPHDTWTLGGRLALRFDAMQRNLLELPHLGVAAGVASDLLRRVDWRPPGLKGPDGERIGPVPDTATVIRLAGYAYAAFGVPFLSEKHRVVAQVHGGWAPPGTIDRFSAFRFGAGPYQSEANDLGRVAFNRVTFQALTAQDYVIGGLTYRYEVLFFLYAHVRVQYAWGHFGEWDPAIWDLRFRDRSAWLFSAGITSGFAFKSQVILEYTFGTGLTRNGRDGSALLLMWSKSF